MKIFDTPPESWDRLRLKHETIYSYGEPVKFGVHKMVLRPREGHELRLHTMDLKTSPAAVVRWHRDIYDNSIAVASFEEEAEVLHIISEFTVSLPPVKEGPTDPIHVPFPAMAAGIERLAAVPYLQHVYPPEVDLLRSWFFKRCPEMTGGTKFPIFDHLASLIFGEIKYNRREIKGVQSPKKTLKLGTGSCRDTAVLMMEVARALGYPSRFVSGYLESSNSNVGLGSTHAWTEVYLPDYGWTGYDPSIGKQVGAGHVPIGVSHHPRGVMPVSGGYNGPPGVTGTLKVKIQTERL